MSILTWLHKKEHIVCRNSHLISMKERSKDTQTLFCSIVLNNMKRSSSFLIFTVLSLPLISAVGWELSIPSTTTARSRLRVREGSRFKIAIFADLHFGEDSWTDWGPRQDENSVNVMSKVLDAETPGQLFKTLIIFSCQKYN